MPVIIHGTNGVTSASWTTSNRPTSPSAGQMGWNSTISDMEFYNGSAWVAMNYTAAPANTVSPVISGTAQTGSTLSCTTGTWTNSPTSYSYAWLANGTPISGATSSTFTITTSQVGANIVCTVTATNLAGSSSVNSNSLGPVINVVSASYLIVAGGGGGYGYNGGGAGGFLSGTATLTPSTVYTVTVGAGGSAGDSNGSNSSLSGSGLTTITSIGGGSGNGKNGGSGGAGGGVGTVGQGNNGGGSQGGGGGAGAAGTTAGNSNGGNGGNGLVNPIVGSTAGESSGGSYYLAGGGAGGSTGQDGHYGGSRGLGGGGANTYFGGSGEDAPANMGGGGGPAGPIGGHGNSGSGGSGVVVLSVPTSSYSGIKTGSPTITTSGSNTIITFNSSGTYTA